MSASALSSPRQVADSGLRQVRLRQDLGDIADLIEVAFADTMDSNGRMAVQEMRSLSRMGPLLWPLSYLDFNLRAMKRGFVWIDPESQCLVGNVSLYGTGYDDGLVVANVATHPDFRRQGIAGALMQATLAYAVDKNASSVLLQVEADNDKARRLYRRLGFFEQRGFIRWRRRPYLDPPERLADMPDVTLRTGREWKAELALAELVRPNEQGGVGWLVPTAPQTFKKTGWAHLSQIGQGAQRWVIRQPDNRDMLLASMKVESPFGSRYSRVTLMVAPHDEYRLNRAMLNFIIRHLYELNRGVVIEHPDDDEAAMAILEAYDFEPTRHLIHMQWLPEI